MAQEEFSEPIIVSAGVDDTVVHLTNVHAFFLMHNLGRFYAATVFRGGVCS